MCGDSTNEADVEKLMDGKLADLVVTDPPYNVDYTGKTKEELKIDNDKMDDDAFIYFLYGAFENLKNYLKDKKSFYIFFATRTHIQFESALNEIGLEVRQELIWVKDHFTLGRQDYQWRHEPIFYGWKDEGEGSHNFIDDRTLSTVFDFESKDFEKMKKSELLEFVKNKYDLPSTTIYNERPVASRIHPTMKPITLIEKLVRNSSKFGDIVLDLFGGSGSTLMACEQMNRVSYTMEYDPAYVDVIVNRWEEFTGRKAELIHDER